MAVQGLLYREKISPPALNSRRHGRTGREAGGAVAPQFVGQTRPVGQYLLQSRANNCYTLTLVWEKCYQCC